MENTNSDKVMDINGNPLSEEKQRDWKLAQKHGLRPSLIRFLNGEPMAVYEDGSGIYGPCPARTTWKDNGR